MAYFVMRFKFRSIALSSVDFFDIECLQFRQQLAAVDANRAGFDDGGSVAGP
jgi:hypothetical protein